MSVQSQQQQIREYKKPKGRKIQHTKPSPPRGQGFVIREPISISMLSAGTYAEHQSIRTMTSFYNLGNSPRINWNLITSDESDQIEVSEALDMYGIGRFNWDDLKKQWLGNRKGGYIIEDVHQAFHITIGEKGMSKRLNEMLDVAKQPEIQAKIRGWGQLCYPCQRTVETIVEYMTYSGGTCVPANLMFRAEMASRGVTVKRAIRQVYLETVKANDYVQRNQQFLLAIDLINNLRGTDIIILTEDTFAVSQDQMRDDAKDPDPYNLNREEIDTISTKAVCALTGHAKLLSRHVDEEHSDIHASLRDNTTTKVIGLAGTRIPIPYLSRGTLYTLGSKIKEKLTGRNHEDASKHVDRKALVERLEHYFELFYQDPFIFRITDCDINTERLHITSDPNYFAVGGAGLSGSARDHELVKRAWTNAGLNKKTRWTLLSYLYSNSPYIYLVLAFHIRGRVPAIEKIYETSTKPRDVRSFKTLVPAKAYMRFTDDVECYINAFAAQCNVHPSRLFTLLREPQPLSEALAKERRWQTPKGSLDLSPFDYWSQNL